VELKLQPAVEIELESAVDRYIAGFSTAASCDPE
jgi:hypothetical protein